MERIQELYVILEDRPGAIGELCSLIERNKINIDTIGVFVDSAKLIVQNPVKTKKILEKNGYTIELRDVIRVEIENKPGELAYITNRIGHLGINIDYLFSSFKPGQAKATVIIDVTDIETVLSLLK